MFSGGAVRVMSLTGFQLLAFFFVYGAFTVDPDPTLEDHLKLHSAGPLSCTLTGNVD